MNGRGARILIVDDEAALGRVVLRNLTSRGFDVQTAASGSEGLATWRRWRPDLIVLDLGLPDLDGLDIIREVRESSNVPIVVLSAREGERDKVRALDSGADDYVSKPFGVEELLARIRVALRHAAHPERGALARWEAGGLAIDFEARTVTLDGLPVRLTPTEYDLLRALVAHPGRVLTDRALLQAVWGPEFAEEHHYLHVYIGRLRRKIERDPQRPRFVRTEPGVGYRFVAEDAETPSDSA
ncbi:MAG: response regulator transcription factor [Dehalococcoidia bacterium]|nr:MAG: response regulator transcription factor [Dehalococcoidia bacterium]